MRGYYLKNRTKYCLEVKSSNEEHRFISILKVYDDETDSFIPVEEKSIYLDEPEMYTAFRKALELFKII